MEDSKLQRLHDTLKKLAPKGNHGGLGSAGIVRGRYQQRDNGLPKNGLYSYFVRPGHFKTYFADSDDNAADDAGEKNDGNAVSSKASKKMKKNKDTKSKDSKKKNRKVKMDDHKTMREDQKAKQILDADAEDTTTRDAHVKKTKRKTKSGRAAVAAESDARTDVRTADKASTAEVSTKQRKRKRSSDTAKVNGSVDAQTTNGTSKKRKRQRETEAEIKSLGTDHHGDDRDAKCDKRKVGKSKKVKLDEADINGASPASRTGTAAAANLISNGKAKKKKKGVGSEGQVRQNMKNKATRATEAKKTMEDEAMKTYDSAPEPSMKVASKKRKKPKRASATGETQGKSLNRSTAVGANGGFNGDVLKTSTKKKKSVSNRLEGTMSADEPSQGSASDQTVDVCANDGEQKKKKKKKQAEKRRGLATTQSPETVKSDEKKAKRTKKDPKPIV